MLPQTGTLRTLKAPAEIRVAFSTHPSGRGTAGGRGASASPGRRVRGHAHGLRAAVPGSLRAILPGERDLEYTAAIAGATFGDAELQKLASAGSDLLWLDLSRTGITDAGLKVLAKMPNLEHLDLRGTAVGDDGVRALAPLHNLQTLGLYGTAVTDAGLPGAPATPSLATALCRRHQGDGAGSAMPAKGPQGAAHLAMSSLRLRRPDDYPSQHAMRGSAGPAARVGPAGGPRRRGGGAVRVLAQGRPGARDGRGAGAGPPRHHLLQPTHPSDLRRQLLPLPRIRSGHRERRSFAWIGPSSPSPPAPTDSR